MNNDYDKDTIDDIERYISSKGLTTKQFFNLKFQTEPQKAYEEICRFSDSERKIYLELLNDLEDSRDSAKNYTKAQKGKALENIVSFLLTKTSLFKVRRNLPTYSNEIDQLVELDFNGIYLQQNGWLDIKGEYFLCECKNYSKSIGVTWVGKLYSLMSYTGSRLAILFSYYGLAGEGWNDASGLAKKIYMLKESHEEKIYIVSFDKSDFKSIANGSSLVWLLINKIRALDMDANFEDLIQKHYSQTILNRTESKLVESDDE